MDPLAGHPNQIDKSPYAAFWNNPVFYTDPDGRCPICPQIPLWVAMGKAYFNRLSGATQRLVTGSSGSISQGAPVPNSVRQVNRAMGTMNDTRIVAQSIVDGPGSVASFTSANDISVLDGGKNLDGSNVNGFDYAFAGVGLFLPVSGNSIKQGFKGVGSELLQGIVKKVDNISSHLTDKDVTGAMRDILGDPIIINGRQFDHLGEVKDALRGLGNQINKLNNSILNGNFTDDVLKGFYHEFNGIAIFKQKDVYGEFFHHTAQFGGWLGS